MRHNRLETAKYLLSKGANVDAVDNYGEGALHFVATFGYHEIAQWIVQSTKIDINRTNKFGEFVN